MTSTFRRILLSVFAALTVLVLASCTSEPAQIPSTPDDVNSGYVSGDGSVRQWEESERGESVDLAGESMQGDGVDIADWRGDVVVLNFWYAECPPCRKEAPDLGELSKEFEGQAHFLGVNHINEPETAIAFERRFELPYPSLYDQDAAGVAALQEYVALQAMPTTVVIDGEGRVAARILGLADKSTLKALITDTLEQV